MTVHAPDCGCETLGCTLRRKGIQVPASALPTRTPRRPWRQGPRYNSWEAGRITESRPGGTSVPVLHPDTGQQITTKEWSENPRLKERLREVKQGINL